MRTICFINQKGGCGKSSCCFHLAGFFAEIGLRVLLIDADPQGSLSQAFFGSTCVEMLESPDTLSVLFEDDCRRWSTATLPKPTSWSGLSVVCSNQTLAPHNRPSPEESGVVQFALCEYLDEIAGYDLTLVDCPPNLYQCSWNALLASDYVLVPVPPEDFGTQGLRAVHQAIDSARTLNQGLELLGHVITRSDRRLLVHRSYEAKLRELYGVTVLGTVIPEASAFKVSLACRKPVTFHAPGSRAADLTSRLGREILDLIGVTNHEDRISQHGQYP